MKKLSLLSIIVVSLFSSCKKVLDAYFDPIETPISFPLGIPEITDSTTEVMLSNNALYLNLDSIIKTGTKRVFDINTIQSVTIKDIALTLTNPDSANNLANFDTVRMALNTSVNTTPVTIGTVAIPATYTPAINIPVSKDVDLRNYLSDTTVVFTLYGKVRHATTRALAAKVDIILRSE